MAVSVTAASATLGAPVHGHATPSRRSSLVSAAVPSAPLGSVDFDLSGNPTGAPSTADVPAEIDIASIGVHAAVVALGRNPDGTVEVPSRFDVVGWFEGGPRPGDIGPAVMLGHVDSYNGPAVFSRLAQLSPGQSIAVSGASGSRQFRVDRVASYDKDRFPTDLVYGPVPERALRLVTCGGVFDSAKHSYRSNVVIFASEVMT
jgi:sortase (surface protein transpeptidase)